MARKIATKALTITAVGTGQEIVAANAAAISIARKRHPVTGVFQRVAGGIHPENFRNK